MKLASVVSDQLRSYLLQLGIFRSVLVLTAISIALSVIVTVVIVTLFYGRPDATTFSLAVLIPAIIAPLFGYFHLHLLFELEQKREELRKLSITDELTSVFNRRYFLELAQREFHRAQRYQQPLSLILFDLDDFKKVNDTFGHRCGDQWLRLVSKVCLETIRRHDVFARYGGEEFALLLPETDCVNAYLAAERIRQIISAQSVEQAHQKIRITISLGVTTLNQKMITFDTLLDCADRALYTAKSKGKNCVAVA